ncbi:MAG: protease modulator HflC [Xanthomonadales bacterium]|nr:protease modulator HflC [Xanthomonadales bacterium]
MNRNLLIALIVIVGGLGLASVFTVKEYEYAIRFQLGRIVKLDYEPGLHFKLPFVNNVRKFEKRLLTLDTAPEPMITQEQKFVEVDSFTKWRIVDVAQFYTATSGGDERLVRQRLDGIVKERIRNQIASRTLVQVISEERVNTMEDIQEAANRAAAEFGVEVVDVRIKSIELPDDVREAIFRRMSADRQKEANLYRFEGREQAEKIRSDADRQAQVILAEAERDGQRLRGTGDARATEIYANAYTRDEEFYSFYRSLQAYGNAFGSSTDVLVLDPNSDFFQYFDDDGVR